MSNFIPSKPLEMFNRKVTKHREMFNQKATIFKILDLEIARIECVVTEELANSMESYPKNYPKNTLMRVIGLILARFACRECTENQASASRDRDQGN